MSNGKQKFKTMKNVAGQLFQADFADISNLLRPPLNLIRVQTAALFCLAPKAEYFNLLPLLNVVIIHWPIDLAQKAEIMKKKIMKDFVFADGFHEDCNFHFKLSVLIY